jgi:hypothetical protein
MARIACLLCRNDLWSVGTSNALQERAAMNSETLLERVYHCIEQNYSLEAGLYARLLVRAILRETGNDYLEHHASYCEQCARAIMDGLITASPICPMGEWIWEREQGMDMLIVPW